MRLTPSSLVLSGHPPGPNIFEVPTALTTYATVTTSLHELQSRLIHRLQTMRPEAAKRMKAVQRRFKENYGKGLYTRPYEYIDGALVTTSRQGDCRPIRTVTRCPLKWVHLESSKFWQV